MRSLSFIGLTRKQGANERAPVLIEVQAIRAISRHHDAGGAFTRIHIGEPHPLLVLEDLDEVQDKLVAAMRRLI